MNAPAQQAAQDPAAGVMALMTAQRSQIEAALPKHMNPDRMLRIAFTELRKNPELAACDKKSFIGAIIQCAQLGLEPGSGLGHAYLIPFNNRRRGIKEVNFVTGYKGLVDLARRSNQVADLYARPVYLRDRFRYVAGDEERIEHEPYAGPVKDRGELVAVYAIAKFKGGGTLREVMWRGDVEEIRDRFGHGNPVWKSDFDEMARKTVVRKLAKYLPLSPELRDAISAEEGVDDGSQENWRSIDVDYEPMAPAHDPAKTTREQNAPSVGARPAPSAAAEADLDHARKEFTAAMNRVLDAGGDPGQVLGEDPEHLLTEADAGTLQNRADLLQAWLNPKPPPPGASSPRPKEDPAGRKALLEAALRGRKVPPVDWPRLIAELGDRPADALRGIVDKYFENAYAAAKPAVGAPTR